MLTLLDVTILKKECYYNHRFETVLKLNDRMQLLRLIWKSKKYNFPFIFFQEKIIIIIKYLKMKGVIMSYHT